MGNCERTAAARNAVVTFLREQGTPDEDLIDILRAVEQTVSRFDQGITSRRKLAIQAKQLIKDIEGLRASLSKMKRIAASLTEKERKESRRSRLDRTGLFHFLQQGQMKHCGPLGSPEAREAGPDFDRVVQEALVQGIPNLEQGALMFERIAEAARYATDPKAGILSRKGHPKDEARTRLGLELAVIWRRVTRSEPTFSAEATPERPGTKFGHFVALVAQLSSRENELKDGFAYLVRTAVENIATSRDGSDGGAR